MLLPHPKHEENHRDQRFVGKNSLKSAAVCRGFRTNEGKLQKASQREVDKRTKFLSHLFVQDPLQLNKKTQQFDCKNLGKNTRTPLRGKTNESLLGSLIKLHKIFDEENDTEFCQ